MVSGMSGSCRSRSLARGPSSRLRQTSPRDRSAGLIATGIVVGAMFRGDWWWTAEASSYSRYVYKPLQVTPTLTMLPPGGRLRLDLRDPGWIESRFLDDLIPDHGHLMHLF